jgi:hypothetical protein
VGPAADPASAVAAAYGSTARATWTRRPRALPCWRSPDCQPGPGDEDERGRPRPPSFVPRRFHQPPFAFRLWFVRADIGARRSRSTGHHLVRHADKATSIPRRSRTRPPEAPGGARKSPDDYARKALLSRRIPGSRRPGPEGSVRPVTPEVAGSSPVAPAFESPAPAWLSGFRLSVTPQRPTRWGVDGGGRRSGPIRGEA